jgi:hypothetical protein
MKRDVSPVDTMGIRLEVFHHNLAKTIPNILMPISESDMPRRSRHFRRPWQGGAEVYSQQDQAYLLLTSIRNHLFNAATDSTITTATQTTPHRVAPPTEPLNTPRPIVSTSRTAIDATTSRNRRAISIGDQTGISTKNFANCVPLVPS